MKAQFKTTSPLHKRYALILHYSLKDNMHKSHCVVSKHTHCFESWVLINTDTCLSFNKGSFIHWIITTKSLLIPFSSNKRKIIIAWQELPWINCVEVSSFFHIVLPQTSIYIFDWYATIPKLLSHHIKLSCCATFAIFKYQFQLLYIPVHFTFFTIRQITIFSISRELLSSVAHSIIIRVKYTIYIIYPCLARQSMH